MTKTQIQLPDALYRRVKAFAETREWSMAETFRRAVEQLIDRYPDAESSAGAWQLPTVRGAGWKGLSADQLHATAVDDIEPSPRRRTR